MFIKFFFINDYTVLLLTMCADKEFQIFMILLKKSCFASFNLKRLPIITSGACEIGSYIVVYVDIVKATDIVRYFY